jgi:hypothetical protein
MNYKDFLASMFEDHLKTNLNFENDIRDFENNNNLLFSKSYKDFIFETNGGSLKIENSAFLLSDYYEVTFVVSGVKLMNFSNVMYEFTNNRINFEPWKFRDIETMVMIGRTDGREYIFIGVSEYNNGKIYYAPDDNVTDFVSLDDDTLIYPTIEIAPNFESFIKMLKDPYELEKLI